MGYRERAEERQRGREALRVVMAVRVHVDDGAGFRVRMRLRVRGGERVGRVRDRRNECVLDLHARRLRERRRRRRGRDVRARVRAVAPVRGQRRGVLGLQVRAVVVAARGRGRGDGVVRAMVVARVHEREDGVVVREQVALVEGELVVENIEELALDAPDVALAEDTGAQRPVDVL